MFSLPRQWGAKSISSALAALFVLVMLSVAAFAQTENGQINGKVTDPNGAVVPNATVTVKSVDTGRTVTATTNSEGTYVVAGLQPGLYDVTVQTTGFAPKTQRVQVTVASETPLDMQLSVGAIGGETVTTIASEGGVEVNTTSQELSNVVSSQQLRELPSLTRNPYDFVALSGNITTDPGGSTARGVGFSINGQRSASTNILLDGGENVDTFTASVGQTVPLDSVQEYRVITNNFSAEFGRASGGIVDVATRPGTNDYHGTLYEFNRVSKLASNGFNNNAQGLPRDHFTRNQFGYSFGGPVRLPRFGEGGPSLTKEYKDKLFFFSSTEWTRVRSNANVINIVPTPQLIAASSPQTQAFFNAFSLATPINGQIYTVGQVVSMVGGNFANNAFANLPANLPAFGEVRYVVPTDVGAGAPQNTYTTVNRIDYNWTNKTQLYGRIAYQNTNFFPGVVNASPYTGFNTGETDRNSNFLLSVTHTFSSRFVSQSKVVVNRLNDLQPLDGAPVVPTLYLTGSAFQTLPGTANDIAFPGYSEFTPGNAIPFGGPQNLFQLYEDASYTRGKHQIKFGGNYIFIQDNRAFGAYEEAVEQLGSNVRNGLNNFVVGNLTSFQAAVYPQGKFPGQTLQLPVGPPDFTRSNRYNDYSLYVNDNYRIRPRFTLNLGLRYEYYGVQHNKNPNLDSNFYFGSGSDIFDQIRNGQVLTVPNSPIGALWKPEKNDFAPRLGFAYDVFGDGKTSIRGGYGIAFERNFGNVTYNVIQNPPNYAVVSLTGADVGGVLPVTLNNSGPLAGSSGTKVLPITSLRYVRNDIAPAYANLYSLSLEHQVARGTVVSLEYSGSHGVHLYSIENINRTGTGLRYLGSEVTNPVTGGLTSRLNGQYSNINTRGNGGYSHYNAFIASIESSNFRNLGLQFTARYTWSHTLDNLSSTFSESSGNFNLGLLDPFNPRLDYGNADYDIRHRFVASFNWDLPFAKNAHGFVKNVLGGYTLTGIFQARTGTPFTVYDCSNAITVCIRAEKVGAVSLTGPKNPPPTPGAINQFNYIDLSGLTPGAGQFATVFTLPNGNQLFAGDEVGPYPADMLARNAFRGPGFWNMDGGIYKTIRFSERTSLQFRGEFYNLFNHANQYVNFGSIDISSSSFVTTQKGITPLGAIERRNIQLAVKLIF